MYNDSDHLSPSDNPEMSLQTRIFVDISDEDTQNQNESFPQWPDLTRSGSYWPQMRQIQDSSNQISVGLYLVQINDVPDLSGCCADQ